jgi:hypothetical protein
MPESHDVQPVIDAAEKAAAAGDYESAERLLRDAARIQEADLGPLHPDLANTLNNLGIVCEIANKPADAELCFRKANAIATVVLEPEHPFAITSRKNLADFCAARRPSIESPTAADENATGALPRVVSSLRNSVRAFSTDSLVSKVRAFSLPFTIIILSLCGLVLVMLFATTPPLRSTAHADSSSVAPPPQPSESSAPGREPAEPFAGSRVVNDRAAGATPRARTRTASALAPTLASANLCRRLSTEESRSVAGDWRCDPASPTVNGGALFFYTRLKSPTETTVEHRWYRDDRLYQAVELRVGANQRNGYRTFSRYTMKGGSAGNWRVEVRSANGALLHEERFAVR